MYEDTYMYAIERNPEYLAHYGIRGMKWGVRKAREMGGARGAKRLSRQYAKAQKKMAKLDKQAAKASKYGRRAALMGAGAAAAGGLAAFGTTKNINNAMRGVGGAMQRAGRSAQMLAATPGKVNPRLGARLARVGIGLQKGGSAVKGASQSVKQWNRSTSISRDISNKLIRTGADPSKVSAGLGRSMGNAGRAINKANLNNNAIARIGAGVVGAGLAAGAARNAYKAATAQKRAAKFKSEMNKAFAGTKYANGGNRQGKKRRRSNRA